MRNIRFTIIILSIFTNCKDSNSKVIKNNVRIELVPEPDIEERLKYEAVDALKKDTCIFKNPDISINNLIIRDSESADKIIGSDNIIDLNEQYHFYSKSKREILTLNQHPGDGRNSISIFKVSKNYKNDVEYKILNIDKFKSEKEIKLGVSKSFVVNNLGECYKEIIHSDNYTEIYYRIEQPNDSETELLIKHNMPVYYASYKFLNNKLFEFEFGLEYP